MPGNPPAILIAVDLETTGLSAWNADIIEVGGVKFTPDGHHMDSFQQLADPGYPIPPEITAINGITSKMLVGAMPPEVVVQNFMAWAGSNVVFVAHNAPFEKSFMKACLQKKGSQLPELNFVDTLRWARQLRLPVDDFKLVTLLKHIGAQDRGLHRALADATGVMELTLFLSKRSRVPWEIHKGDRKNNHRIERDGASASHWVGMRVPSGLELKPTELKRLQRQRSAEEREEKEKIALERTEQALKRLQDIEGILEWTLNVYDAVDWESLKDFAEFPIPRPETPQLPPPPQPLILPEKPKRTDPQFVPKLGLLARISGTVRTQREQEAETRFLSAHTQWEADARERYELHKVLQTQHQQMLGQIAARHANDLREWESKKQDFAERRDRTNAVVDKKRKEYCEGNAQAVLEYCRLVLSRSRYPEDFRRSYDLTYLAEQETMVVEHSFPTPDALPTLREVKYVIAKDEFVEKHISKTEQNRLYESVLYQTALRAIHELFEADQVEALLSVVFNGYVEHVDPATGREVNACVLSLRSNREEFLEINLARIDPKACFAKLKGVSGTKLSNLTTVEPLIRSSRRCTPQALLEEYDE